MGNKRPLDAIDRAILFHLRQDGRLSNVELARRVGLTPPPCLRRVKRLEDDGVILGYRAQIDPAAEGRGMEVIVTVEINVTNFETLQKFEAAIAALDEVIEARRVFGTPDYFLRVAVADHTEYERFQTHKLIGLPGIGRVVSYQTMKWIKMET
jgi:DNA-binding Lrp family transcriptional regulator